MSNVKDPSVTGSSQEQETTDSQPSYVTREDIGNVVNSAVTAQLKRLNLSKQVTDALETSLAPFREQFAGRQTEPAQGADKSTALPPELAAMQKKMDLMEKSIRDREQQITAKERASREREAYSKVSSELAALGVRAEGVDHLAKILKVDGKIKVDDDGAISFLDGEEERDLVSGLRSYLNPKTNPSVALYLPPKAPLKGAKGVAESRTGTVDVASFKDIKDPAKRTAAMLEHLKNSKK